MLGAPRSRAIADVKLPRAGLIAMVIAGIAVATVLFWARNLNFYLDEYAFVLNSQDWTFSSYWHPNLEHWITLSALVYRGELAVFGMRTHLPFIALLALLNAGVALLLFALIRRRSGDLPAVAAMALLLFMGQGYENILQPFQITVVGSAFFGLAALWILEKDSHLCRLLGAAAIVAGLMCSGFGLFFMVAVAVSLAMERRWRALPEVLTPPAVAYSAWFLTFGAAGLNHSGWPHDIQTAWSLGLQAAHGVGATFTAVLGIDPHAAYLGLQVPAAAVFLWWRRGRVEPLALASGVALTVQFLLIGLERSLVGVPAPRYLQIGAIFALVLLADCLRGLPWRPPWRPAMVVLLAAALMSSGLDLYASARGLEIVETIQNAELQTVMLFRGAPDLNLDAVVDPLVSPYVTPRRYYEAVDRYGSPVPVIETSGLDRLPPEAVNQAMRAIFTGSVAESPGMPPSDAECMSLGAPLIELHVASGSSLWVNGPAGQTVVVLLWFQGAPPNHAASTFQAGAGWERVHIPDTGKRIIWRLGLSVSPGAVGTVCAPL